VQVVQPRKLKIECYHEAHKTSHKNSLSQP